MTDEIGVAQERKEISVEDPKMHFILKGFSQDTGFRIFAFDGIAEDRTRTAFTVRTDLALTRRYAIRLQELPLLCREILERRDAAEETRAFTYTEEDMSLHADCVAAKLEAAQKKRKPPRPPVSDHAGAAWRVPPR